MFPTLQTRPFNLLHFALYQVGDTPDPATYEALVGSPRPEMRPAHCRRGSPTLGRSHQGKTVLVDGSACVTNAGMGGGPARIPLLPRSTNLVVGGKLLRRTWAIRTWMVSFPLVSSSRLLTITCSGYSIQAGRAVRYIQRPTWYSPFRISQRVNHPGLSDIEVVIIKERLRLPRPRSMVAIPREQLV